MNPVIYLRNIRPNCYKIVRLRNTDKFQFRKSYTSDDASFDNYKTIRLGYELTETEFQAMIRHIRTCDNAEWEIEL